MHLYQTHLGLRFLRACWAATLKRLFPRKTSKGLGHSSAFRKNKRFNLLPFKPLKTVNPGAFGIGSHSIGLQEQPFIIAEMSGNHGGSLERALALVEIAAQAGVHALKLQTYTADTMTIDYNKNEFFIADKESLWTGKSLYQLYQEASTPWEWHPIIFKRCEELGLLCFSTPFDKTAVDFLETLNVPCYKIASFENTDLDLIQYVARCKKPMIISTGLSSLAEIAETVQVARAAGCENLILLKCTSAYPADPQDSHLNNIPALRDLFGCEIGLSDHTLGIAAAIASVALGATVIEKHFTDTRDYVTVDSAFSLTATELAMLVQETQRAQVALGSAVYKLSKAEERQRIFKRSLYIVENLKAGDILNDHNMRAIRPGLGLPIKYRSLLLGKQLSVDCSRGTPLSWKLIK